MKGEHAIRALCALLGVAPSGYYRWRQHRPSPRDRDEARLAAQIAQSHAQSRGNYGTPRIVADLRAQGTQAPQAALCAADAGEGLARTQTTLPATAHHRQSPCGTGRPNLLAQRPEPTGPIKRG